MTTSSPRQHHPLLLAAAVAVILFCAAGIAALMGWLPSRGGNGADQAAYAGASGNSSQLAAANLAPLPAGQDNGGYQPGPAPGSSLAQGYAPPAQAGSTAPERAAVAPEPERAAQAVPSVCTSCGVVESVREVSTRAQGSGLGAGAGAVLGGLLGNQVGGGHGRQLATVAGAVGGAVVGNQVEGNVRATRSYTIRVRMDDGSHRTFSRSSSGWSQGERVRVVKGELRHQ